MKRNLIRLLSISFAVLTFVGTAAAQTQGQVEQGGGGRALITVTGALAVAIAAAFGALGDAKAIAAACEGTARNPGAGGRIFTMMILGLALIETLVLFTFLMAFLERR